MNKIVTFTRSADFLHTRAMRNRRNGSMLDALDLMRGALERDGENLAYRMDLAELYCEMGCYRQSIRLLLGVLSGGEPVSECLFGLCCNYIGMRDYAAAHSLMLWFLMADPESIERQEVAETLALLMKRQADAYRSGRKHRRAQRFAARGRALLRARAGAAGIQMLRRAHALAPDDQHIAALLADALSAAGRRREARGLIARALRAKPVAVGTRCVAANLYASLGDGAAAQAQFDAVRSGARDEDDQFLLLHAAARAGFHRLVLDTCNEILRVLPYDAQVLHMKAAALVNLGEPDAQARRHWERIIRLDPSDESAKYYAAAAARGELQGKPVGYGAELPEPELRARAAYLLGRPGEDPDALWDGSARYRSALSWLAQAQNAALTQAALALLNRIDRPGAALAMRECLLRPDLSRAQRSLIADYLAAHGHAAPYIAPDGLGRLMDAAAARDGQRAYTPAQRRVIALAVRAHASGQGKGTALVETAWRDFLLRCGPHKPRILRPAAWSAALIAVRLKLQDDPDAIGLLSKMFRCPSRMIARCARRIRRTAQPPKEESSDETD